VADWDSRFLDMARLVSSWSKDPSTQVGAVITRGKFVVSLGFNGHPKGVKDSPERLENREVKYRTIIHAEMNAIAQAAKNGASIKEGAIYITHTPCIHCLKVLVNTGLKEIYYEKPYKLHTLEELLRYTQVHLHKVELPGR